MNKREVRKKRTTDYFVLAACQIIENDGLNALSVRKVADIAGYHYATLYSYFKDVYELKFLAALKFMDDIYEYMLNFTKDMEFSSPVEHYLWARKAIAYFAFEHQDAYRLINFTYFGENTKNVISKLMQTKAAVLENTLFDNSSEFLGISKQRAQLLHTIVRSIFHSYFTGYSEKRFEKNKDDVVKNYGAEIKEIFEIFRSAS
ncbi:TetR/AcrR family transcriptional regulator [candidate division WOR-3 bacterium]|nr:TetR/AcrR family transcriptional regulator [candidate division WOR-3 bacterium]